MCKLKIDRNLNSESKQTGEMLAAEASLFYISTFAGMENSSQENGNAYAYKANQSLPETRIFDLVRLRNILQWEQGALNGSI